MSVYTWGLGKSGQLGHDSCENSLTPKWACLPGSSAPRLISSGGLFSAVISDDGEIYSFGCGKYGRLGHKDEADRVKPTRVDLPADTKVVQISCGSWHGAAVTDKAELFIWGYNKSHGVQGYATPGPWSTPAQIPKLLDSGLKIMGVSCGNNFTLAWTEDGQAFSWGFGQHGVLGHGDEKDQLEPKLIDALATTKVKSMNAGYAHCAAVNEDGQVFMFGQGKYGALGLGKGSLNSVHAPEKISIPNDSKIESVSCSVGEHHGHTLAVAADGQVFAWGDGYKGKLGLGDQEFRYSPTVIPKENFNGELIKGVSAGGIHSSAVSQEGHVFTWGCGSDGRLGHPEAKGHRYLFRSDIPRMVEGLKGTAIQVEASYYHTMALTT